MNIKTDIREYSTPVTEQIGIFTESILCQSGGLSTGLEDMTEGDHTLIF